MENNGILNGDYNGTFLFYFEKKFINPKLTMSQINWLRKNWTLSILYSFAYLFLVYTGRRLMRNRPKFHLYRSLIAWNILHSIFSILGIIFLLGRGID